MTEEKQRVLVAGATGYLGGFVAREFKARGHFVRALARNPQKLDPMKEDLDEIVEGEITIPESIRQICDGIDVVFSSVGITRQKNGLTFRDVDYQGNLNLLQVAQKADVKKFIYISAFKGPELLHLDIIKAHEDFANVLKSSGMNYAIIRPNGYFSDMETFFDMARKGRVYLFGPGTNRINPIHGADLAVTCADAISGKRQEIDAGGPEILSYRDIAEIAFEALGKPVKTSSVPVWMIRLTQILVKLFNKHLAGILAFVITAATTEGIAPQTGTHTLRDHYRNLAAGKG